MDRRWNDLNALRQAREHLKEIERLERQSASLKQELQKAKENCSNSYMEVRRATYPTNNESSLRAQFERKLPEPMENREHAEKTMKWLLILWGFAHGCILSMSTVATSGDAAIMSILFPVLSGFLWAYLPIWMDECDGCISELLCIFGYMCSIQCLISVHGVMSYTDGAFVFGPVNYFCLFVSAVLMVLRLILPKMVKPGYRERKVKYTAEQKKQLEEAAALDARNAEEYKNYVQRMNQQAQQYAREVEKRSRPKIEDTERKIYENYQALQRLDILGRNEQNLSAVNALIDIMESHRADSIPEALRVYDAQRHYHNQVVQAQFNERMNLLEQKWQRQEQFDRDMAAAAHRREVEALLQKQLDALGQD